MVNFLKDVDVMAELPTVLQDVVELNAIARVEDPILTAEWGLIQGIFDNQFIMYTNEDGISRYENMLNIYPLDTDTLETRRLRVMARFQEQAPYTWRVLIGILDGLLGLGNYTATRDVASKTIDIKIQLVQSQQVQVVIDMLERITPVNMIYTVSLMYNTYQQLSAYTHQQLSAYTHQQLREGQL